jgi:hypothetical protein
MKTFQKFLRESLDPKVSNVLKQFGYGHPQPGDDGHTTFTKGSGDQMLIDVPGNEWHHMINGVIKKVGNLSDGSLRRFLE